MSLPRFSNYKDSGVEWLGEVPAHWEVISIKWISPVKRGASPRPIDDPKYFDEDGEFAWVRIADVSSCDGLLTETTQRLSELGSSLSVKMMPGDLFVSIAGTVGKPCISAIKACIHDGFVYFPTLQINPKFLYRVFEGGNCYGGLGKWGTQLNLNTDTIGSIRIALPPPNELSQVLEFLDRETAKIDELVAEQRRLMNLLKEKRQAVISHAVTRGLNPDAPLKPSGIEWLGDVPAHWDVVPIKRIVSVPITDGPHETPNFIEEGVPFVSAEAVSSGSINFSKVRACISEEDNARYSLKYAPQLHDIYMVKSGATTGITAIVEGRTDFNIWSPLAAIRCNANSVPHFVLNFMRSKHFQEAVTLFWSFGTQQNIGMGVIENLACTVPPVNEQHAIAAILKTESEKFDTLTTEAQRAIDLLQERRTALISAAVTGQIDVRNLATSA
ncbi:MAG: restriction endonuclease subunit S [Pseudomonadota bacterium]